MSHFLHNEILSSLYCEFDQKFHVKRKTANEQNFIVKLLLSRKFDIGHTHVCLSYNDLIITIFFVSEKYIHIEEADVTIKRQRSDDFAFV